MMGWFKKMTLRLRSAKKFASIAGDTHGDVKLRNAYAQSVWVMRAIKLVSTPIAGVSLQLQVLGADGTPTEVSDPTLQAYWRKPFVGLSYDDGIEATVGWLKLQGDCFWLLDDGVKLPFPEVAARSQILISGPDAVRIIYRGDEILAYEYTTRRGTKILFEPDQVWHHKFWNPSNPERGQSELGAVMNAAESDWLAGNFQRNLNRSNGDQGVYVVAKNGFAAADTAQREQIEAQLRAKQRANRRGETMITFLSGDDFKIEDSKVRTPDAAFLAGRFADREEIFIGLGVPASMSSKQTSYSVGSASDRFVLIEDTCIPLGKKICEGIDFVLEQQIGGQATAECVLNWREHSTMQQVRAERGKEIDALWNKGVPMAVIDDYLGLGLPEYAGKELGYLPFNVAPVGSEPEPAVDPALAEKQPEHQRSAFATMVDALRRADESDADVADAGEQFQADRPAAEKKLWESHMRRRRGAVKRTRSAFKRVLMTARAETLRKLDELGGTLQGAAAGGTVVQRAAAADFIFDLEVFRTAFFGAMRKSAHASLTDAGMQVFDELGVDDVFTMAPEPVLLFTRGRENLLRNIPDEVHADIMDTLEAGIRAGESTDKLAARVKASFNAIESARARTIAQTETGAAYGYGRDVSMRQAGVTHKKWLTSGNTNVRPSHRAANGQVVKLDEDFMVGDDYLSHPCDGDGDPSETINCHCVAIAEGKNGD